MDHHMLRPCWSYTQWLQVHPRGGQLTLLSRTATSVLQSCRCCKPLLSITSRCFCQYGGTSGLNVMLSIQRALRVHVHIQSAGKLY